MQQLASEIHEWFLGHNKTLSFAESCTGGQLSATITALPGASQYFLGSVVSYARSIKADVLNVSLPLMQVAGEVSTPVAQQMARGARLVLGSDWSVSVTGIAGPGGGTEKKPVGTVCFGVSGPGFEYSEEQHFKVSGREEIQRASVEHAFKLLKIGIQS